MPDPSVHPGGERSTRDCSHLMMRSRIRRHGYVKFLRYWVDEKAGMVFRLSDAPNREAPTKAHGEHTASCQTKRTKCWKSADPLRSFLVEERARQSRESRMQSHLFPPSMDELVSALGKAADQLS